MTEIVIFNVCFQKVTQVWGELHQSCWVIWNSSIIVKDLVSFLYFYLTNTQICVCVFIGLSLSACVSWSYCVYWERVYSLLLESKQRSVVSGVGECLQFLQVHRLTPICARSLINRGIWWFWRGMPAAPWGAANSVLGQALAPHI